MPKMSFRKKRSRKSQTLPRRPSKTAQRTLRDVWRSTSAKSIFVSSKLTKNGTKEACRSFVRQECGRFKTVYVDFVAVLCENQMSHLLHMIDVIDSLLESDKYVRLRVPGANRVGQVRDKLKKEIMAQYDVFIKSLASVAGTLQRHNHDDEDFFTSVAFPGVIPTRGPKLFIGMGGSTPELFYSFNNSTLQKARDFFNTLDEGDMAILCSAYSIVGLENNEQASGSEVKNMDTTFIDDKEVRASQYVTTRNRNWNKRGLGLAQDSAVIVVPHSASANSACRPHQKQLKVRGSDEWYVWHFPISDEFKDPLPGEAKECFVGSEQSSQKGLLTQRTLKVLKEYTLARFRGRGVRLKMVCLSDDTARHRLDTIKRWSSKVKPGSAQSNSVTVPRMFFSPS